VRAPRNGRTERREAGKIQEKRRNPKEEREEREEQKGPGSSVEET